MPMASKVHLAGQHLVDVAGGIVGDGGEMDDLVDALNCTADGIGIAQVTLDQFEPGAPLGETRDRVPGPRRPARV
jgi:hypothetical protein